MTATLSQFQHRPAPRADTSSRVTAGALTAALYALFALLVWWSLTSASIAPVTVEIPATLLPDVPHKRTVILRPPALTHLLGRRLRAFHCRSSPSPRPRPPAPRRFPPPPPKPRP